MQSRCTWVTLCVCNLAGANQGGWAEASALGVRHQLHTSLRHLNHQLSHTEARRPEDSPATETGMEGTSHGATSDPLVSRLVVREEQPGCCPSPGPLCWETPGARKSTADKTTDWSLAELDLNSDLNKASPSLSPRLVICNMGEPWSSGWLTLSEPSDRPECIYLSLSHQSSQKLQLLMSWIWLVSPETQVVRHAV